MFKVGDKVKVVTPFFPIEQETIHTVTKLLPGMFVELNNSPTPIFAMEGFELVQGESEPELTPHKHAEFIKAWADGAEIQCLQEASKQWVTLSEPRWDIVAEYRIKPSEADLQLQKEQKKALTALINEHEEILLRSEKHIKRLVKQLKELG